MYYIQLNKNQVMQIIPEEDPIFPGVPITDRYAQDFLDQCIIQKNADEVRCGMIYDPKTGIFAEPSRPEKNSVQAISNEEEA